KNIIPHFPTCIHPKKWGVKNAMKNKALDSPKKQGGEQVGNFKSGEQKWGVVGNEQKKQR
ncbi:hypothetical protein ACRW1M_28055, partial [Escherichia coli]